MRLNDPTTWPEADTAIEIDEDPELGKVRVRQWIDLHFYRAPGYPVNLILIERMNPMSNGQPFPPLWLVWVGERNLPKRNCAGLSIYDVLEWIIGIGLLSKDYIGHCLT